MSDSSDDDEEAMMETRTRKKTCVSYFIIHRNGRLNSMLRVVHIIASMVSSYFYVWLAAFGTDPDKFQYKVAVFFEVLFGVLMISNFFTDFTRDGENIPVDDVGEIALNYLHNKFAIDMIPLLPISFFLDNSQYKFYRIFFVLKIVRVKTGFDAFNIGQIYSDIRDFFTYSLKQKILNNPEISSDMD